VRHPLSARAGEGVLLDQDFKVLPIGKGVILTRWGVYLLASARRASLPQSGHVDRKRGHSCGVVNMRFVKRSTRNCSTSCDSRQQNFVTVESTCSRRFARGSWKRWKAPMSASIVSAFPTNSSNTAAECSAGHGGTLAEKIAQTTLAFLKTSDPPSSGVS